MNRRTSFFPWVLGLIMLVFCGILVFAWYESKLANPIMLDEAGHVRGGGN